MNRWRVRFLAQVGLVLVAGLSLGQTTTGPAAKGKFTISKETTVVGGPLNADGTIDYISAINEILRTGVTPESNAAIPLLQAMANARIRDSLLEFIKELKVSLPADGSTAVESLDDFISGKQGTRVTEEESTSLDESRKKSQAGPWTAQEIPAVAEWLNNSQKGLALIEEACGRPRCFMPWMSKNSPPTFLDSMPPLSIIRAAADPVLARAMLCAGNGDVKGACLDLSRVRKLARFSAEQRTDIGILLADALDALALRGFEGMAINGKFKVDDLELIRREIKMPPEIPSLAQVADIEEKLALDGVMMTIRGDGKRVLMAEGLFEEDVQLDLGNLPRANWDAVMIAIHRKYEDEKQANLLPFETLLKHYDEQIRLAAADQVPDRYEEGGTTKSTVEKFLRLRPGESSEAYGERIGKWWMGDGPSMFKRMHLEAISKPAC